MSTRDQPLQTKNRTGKMSTKETKIHAALLFNDNTILILSVLTTMRIYKLDGLTHLVRGRP